MSTPTVTELQAEVEALRAKVTRVEARVQKLRHRHDSLPHHAGAAQRSELSAAIGGLLDDLGDGQCRCAPLNGTGPLVSVSGLKCEHGTPDPYRWTP